MGNGKSDCPIPQHKALLIYWKANIRSAYNKNLAFRPIMVLTESKEAYHLPSTLGSGRSSFSVSQRSLALVSEILIRNFTIPNQYVSFIIALSNVFSLLRRF